MAETHKTLSLVLGSGGARGHAHIGVIRAIEERGLVIRNIAGSSMGALVGGMYAAGKLDTYTDWANHLERSDVVRLLDFAFSRKSIFKGERVFEVLRDLVGDPRIEDLDRGFTAVATALDEQREVWLSEGSLFRAMRASCAVPGVFAPVIENGRTLVDGGLVNPVPIAPTLNDATDLTIAVNLNAMAPGYRRPERRKRTPTDDDKLYRSRITRFVAELFAGEENEDGSPGAADTLVRSIDVMQGAIARLKLAAYAPDRVVDVPREACGFFEFHRAEEMAALGYQRTCRALDDLGL